MIEMVSGKKKQMRQGRQANQTNLILAERKEKKTTEPKK